jgi:uncharacterized protein (TIGR04222 family)
MEDTWGIAGPDFLALYLLAFSISLLFAFALRIITRSGAVTSTAASGALTTLEVACLTGGPRRVVEAAVAQLVDDGQLRPSRTGYLQVAAHTEGTNPVERTVLADVRRYGRRSVRMLTDRLATSDAVLEVADRLVRAGYLVDENLAARRKTLGLIPVVAVVAIGVLRWFAGLADDRPIGYLTLLLIGSGLFVLLLRRQTPCPRTFRGVNAVRGVAVAATPADSVATGGLPGYPDQTIRMSLLATSAGRSGHSHGAALSGGAWAAGAAGGGLAGDGGSSCGGGGCGG